MFNKIRHIQGVSKLQIRMIRTTKMKTENRTIFMNNEKLENHSFASYDDLKVIREYI